LPGDVGHDDADHADEARRLFEEEFLYGAMARDLWDRTYRARYPEENRFGDMWNREVPPEAIAMRSVDPEADAEYWRQFAGWVQRVAGAVQARVGGSPPPVAEGALARFEAALVAPEVLDAAATDAVPASEMSPQDIRWILADVRQVLSDRDWHRDSQIVDCIGRILGADPEVCFRLGRQIPARSTDRHESISRGRTRLARLAAGALGCESRKRGKALEYRLPVPDGG
jgi:hypothetical protein